LGVTLRREPVAALNQSAAQLAVVVDLAVEYDDLRAVLVENRLMSPREIDDAQAAHAEADGALGPNALIVRAAMTNGVAHRANRCRVDRAGAIVVDEPCNAAHGEEGLGGAMKSREFADNSGKSRATGWILRPPGDGVVARMQHSPDAVRAR